MRRDATSRPSASPPVANGRVWLHASCVAVAGEGVLLTGRSGAGKSDLALRLIDGGAELVADDQVGIERIGPDLVAQPATALAGLLEVRGAGIWRMPWRERSRLALVVDLDVDPTWPRLPEPERHLLLGAGLAHLRLDPRAPSACAKVRLALAAERVV